VVDKRPTETEDGRIAKNRRRRECTACNKRFTTYEVVESAFKIAKIRKRDGNVVDFDKDKITNAIFKGVQAVGGTDRKRAEELADQVVKLAEEKYAGEVPTVEGIQDLVEKVLIEEGHAKVAKAYILYRQKRAELRELQKQILNGRTTKLAFSLNALKVLAGRYLQHDYEGNVVETPEEMFERTARVLSEVERDYGKSKEDIERIKKEFYEVMASFEFTPAGRTITNAGTSTPLVANCIVLHMEDSMDGIFQTLRDASLLQQAGSGLGFPFHLLRPAGSIAKTSKGVASGPVSFLRVYNDAFGVIKQQGRHGANMAIMRVDHPDILDFVHSKEIEGDIKNFNISVGLTDEFMQKVKDNDQEPWMCHFRDQKILPRKITRDRFGSVKEIKEIKIKPRQLFEEIVNGAWNNGEPGVAFIDTVNKSNPVPGLGRIEACNPCVTGDSLVSTEHGLVTIKTLAEKHGEGGIKAVIDNRIPTEVQYSDGTVALLSRKPNGTSLSEISVAFKTGVKPVYKLVTDFGYELEATGDHKIMTTEGWVRMDNLTTSHKVLIQAGEGKFSGNNKIPFEVQNTIVGKNSRVYRYNFPQKWSRELGQVLGWLVGDGWIRDKENEYMAGLTFGKDDIEVFNYLKPIIDGFYGNSVKEMQREKGTIHLDYQSKDFVHYIKKLGVKDCKAEEKCVPESIFTSPREAVIGFLQGLFSADGTVRVDEKGGNYYVRLTSKSLKLLKQVQLLLLNLGIKSKIYNRSRNPRDSIFKYVNKKGEKKEYGSDGILFEIDIHKSGLIRFLKEIGFLCNKNKEKIERILEKDIREDSNFFDSAKEVKYIGEKEVYDLTEPLTHSFVASGIVISNCGEQYLHDGDVCNLGSINLAKFVINKEIDFDRLKDVTRIAIRMLDNVIDRSSFPVDKVNKVFRGNRRIGLGVMGFADMLYQLEIRYNSPEGFKIAEAVMKCIQEEAHKMSQELAEEKGVFPNWNLSIYKKQGIKMRNAALTTIAPTGTISMMFDCSSGLEPNYALVFMKAEVMGGQTLYYVNKYFEDELKKRGLYSDELMREVSKTGSIQNLDLPKDMKEVFATAMDIPAEDHIRMQAAFQKQVDNSITKTINFSSTATKEDVARGYLLAWELSCKGCTVYRDKSRKIQVLKTLGDEEVQKPDEATAAEKKEEEPVEGFIATKSQMKNWDNCPTCKSINLDFGEGCVTCKDCGLSACFI